MNDWRQVHTDAGVLHEGYLGIPGVPSELAASFAPIDQPTAQPMSTAMAMMTVFIMQSYPIVLSYTIPRQKATEGHDAQRFRMKGEEDCRELGNGEDDGGWRPDEAARRRFARRFRGRNARKTAQVKRIFLNTDGPDRRRSGQSGPFLLFSGLATLSPLAPPAFRAARHPAP